MVAPRWVILLLETWARKSFIIMLVVAETTTVCFEVQSTFDAAFMVFDLA